MNRNILNITQMSWYGNYNQSTRQLDILIETKPSLASLLMYPDFIQQLKSFNPKLLDYLTNSPTIAQEIVAYISKPPLQSDSVDRKYKLPLLAIEMVETETTCIINSLLKQSSPNCTYFQSMFDMLKQPEILPLLAGYFGRTSLALCRSRYKQALQAVFSSTQNLQLLINHSQNQTIANCLPLYLCVQSTKNIFLPEDKIAVKMAIVRSILNKIQSQRSLNNQKSMLIIQNLCFVVRQIIERYYLINNGKQMLQIILQEKYVATILLMIGQHSQNSFPAMSLVLSFLKYYSLSAFNSQQTSQELSKKNMERLQSQSFVKIMCSSFALFIDKVKRQKQITLYSYNLLQVLCHCITLSSNKVLSVIKQVQLFPVLIDLLFRNQNCNILHKLVERTFLHVFTTQKNIYEKYKQYLFCEISVIDLTAKRLLELFPESDGLQKAKHKGYFGILIKIIKIYSSITTVNVNIREAITAKTEIWNKMTKKIIRPYEANCKEQMGQLQNVPQNIPVQFTVRRTQNQLMPRFIQNVEVLEQIKREEQTMPKTLELSDMKKQSQTLSQTKIQDDSFFKSPLEDSLNKKKIDSENSIITSSVSVNINGEIDKQSPKKSVSFTQFLTKKKVEVGEEIKMQRSQSGEKRLSADKKTRLTSPSPSRKKNSWKQEQGGDDDSKKDKRIALTKDLPKIPVAHKIPPPNHLTKSTVQEHKKSQDDQSVRVMSLSMANMESLKKTTIIRTNEIPVEKKYRKVQEKDKALFAYLGLRC